MSEERKKEIISNMASMADSDITVLSSFATGFKLGKASADAEKPAEPQKERDN